MSLLSIFFSCMIGFFCLRLLILPKLAQGLKNDRTVEAIGKSAWLGLLSYLSGVLLIGSISSGGTLMALAVLEKMGTPIRPEEVTPGLEMVDSMRGMLTGLGWGWGITSFLMILVGMGIHSWKKGKLRLSSAFGDAFQREHERLKGLLEKGELPELPPSEEMALLQEKLNELDELRQSAKDDLDEEQRAAIFEELDGHEENLVLAINHNDLARRMGNVTLDENEQRFPPPRNFVEKMQTFMMSEGLIWTMGKGSRLLILASMLLLIPSFLGIKSPDVGEKLEVLHASIFQARFDMNQEEARNSWESALDGIPKESKDKVLSKADEEILDLAAEQFENKLAQDEEWSSSTQNFRIPNGYRAARVAGNVLELGAKHVNQSSASRNTQVGGVGSSSDKKAAFHEAIDESRAKPKPKTKIGVEYRENLKQVVQRSPSKMIQLRAEVPSFQVHVGGRRLENQMIKVLVGNVAKLDPTGIMRLINDAVSPEVSKALEKHQRAKMHHTLTALSQGENYSAAMENVNKLPKATISPNDLLKFQESLDKNMRQANTEFNQRFKENRPRFEARATPSSNNSKFSKVPNEKILRKTFDNLHVGLPTRSSSAIIERGLISVSGYSDFFPADVRSMERSTKGKLESELASSGALSVKSDDLKRSRSAAVSRAGNFRRLRGYSRIGGVLIGRPPSSGDALAINDIQWREKKGTLILSLTLKDGTVISSIPHKKKLIWHALLYAADGRPTTVTMITTGVLPFLKILVHPTLVDTSMGYALTEMDRFVDKYTGKSSKRENETQTVQTQDGLYKYAWGIRASAVIEAIPESQRGQWADIQGVAQNVAEENMVSAHYALKKPEQLNGNYPLKTKTAFYDSALVRSIIIHARSANGDFTKFTRSLLYEYSESASDILASENSANRVFSAPPEFQVWSGVRESDYKLDLRNILMVKTARAILHSKRIPLTFMLQVAFTSEPIFKRKSYEGSNACSSWNEPTSEGYIDDPWQFPSLGDFCNREVLRKTALDPLQDRKILYACIEFTMLQRLFRLAFNGCLGPDFPTDKLETLALAVQPKSGDDYQTMRWNVQRGLTGQYATQLVEHLEEIGTSSAVKPVLEHVRSLQTHDRRFWAWHDLETGKGAWNQDRIQNWEQKWLERGQFLDNWVQAWQENHANISFDNGETTYMATVLQLYVGNRIHWDMKKKLEESYGFGQRPSLP